MIRRSKRLTTKTNIDENTFNDDGRERPVKVPTQTTLPLRAQLLPPVRAHGDNTPCDEVGAGT